MSEMDNTFIHNYAFCGTAVGFDNMLSNLADIAESEIWSFSTEHPYELLKKYIFGTFSQCQKQHKVLLSKDKKYSCFNTGLLTPNGNDIIGLFEKNTRADAQPWVLKGFRDKCNREFMDLFPDIPELASYTNNFEELYFNPEYNIVINVDHILDDNWDRLQTAIPLSKTVVKTISWCC